MPTLQSSELLWTRSGRMPFSRNFTVSTQRRFTGTEFRTLFRKSRTGLSEFSVGGMSAYL